MGHSKSAREIALEKKAAETGNPKDYQRLVNKQISNAKKYGK